MPPVNDRLMIQLTQKTTDTIVAEALEVVGDLEEGQIVGRSAKER